MLIRKKFAEVRVAKVEMRQNSIVGVNGLIYPRRDYTTTRGISGLRKIFQKVFFFFLTQFLTQKRTKSASTPAGFLVVPAKNRTYKN